jgi:hypothetical protein
MVKPVLIVPVRKALRTLQKRTPDQHPHNTNQMTKLSIMCRNLTGVWPPRKATLSTSDMGRYRGVDDGDMEMDVDDGGHQGRAWLTFFRSKHPELAAKVRVRLLAEIRRRWPDARDVPVMPNGALPLADDLFWTGTSYAVKPERLADYTGRGG